MRRSSPSVSSHIEVTASHGSKNRRAFCWKLGLTLALVLPCSLTAQNPKKLALAAGSKMLTEKGVVQGSSEALYSLSLSKGQQVRLRLRASNSSTYFNVYPPGVIPGSGEALFTGAEKGDVAELRARLAGDYLIQVFLMRNVARRGAASSYSLSIAAVSSGR